MSSFRGNAGQQRNTCENITLPILRMRAVKTQVIIFVVHIFAPTACNVYVETNVNVTLSEKDVEDLT